VDVPYMPGHAALQRGPLLEAAVRELEPTPDILVVNATGRDHPRRAGLALHLGAVLDLITVGVTDHPLVATAQEPGPEKGATAPLSIDGEIVAVVLRTRRHVRPVVVHPAWRTDPETARLMVEQCTAKARSPEPLRVARFLARTQRARDEGRLVAPPQPIDTVLRPR
jgi:deoxyribonuclease V